MKNSDDLAEYLEPTPFIDSDVPAVIDFARRAIGDETDDVRKAVRLFYAVRDGIVYTPYLDFNADDTYRASACLAKGAGFCVGKAALLAAAARAVGIPARVGFADVKNHLCTPRLRAVMGTDVFYFHGYTELYLRGRWMKATPAFDGTLCQKFGVRPLEFDGTEHSLFHPFDTHGRRHMEYLRDRGPQRDVPAKEIIETFQREYPGFAAAGAASDTAFRTEAEAR